MPGPIIPWGGAAAAPSAPAGSLIARYDASDTAAHNVGSGLVSPSAGSEAIDLQFKNAGTPTALVYGATQNGLAVLSSPASHAFVPASSMAGTVTEVMIVAAHRIQTHSAGQHWKTVRTGGSNTMGIYVDSTSLTQLNYTGVGNPISLTLTGLNTGDGTFRIIGLIYDAATLGLLANDREGSALTQSSMASYSDAIYPLHTAGSFADAGSIDLCELLLYNSASPGTLALAIHYLKQKWSP